MGCKVVPSSDHPRGSLRKHINRSGKTNEGEEEANGRVVRALSFPLARGRPVGDNAPAYRPHGPVVSMPDPRPIETEPPSLTSSNGHHIHTHEHEDSTVHKDEETGDRSEREAGLERSQSPYSKRLRAPLPSRRAKRGAPQGRRATGRSAGRRGAPRNWRGRRPPRRRCP